MGIIDIDDRDVFNYYEVGAECGPTPATNKFKEWLGRLKAEIPTAIINHLGAGRYKIDLPSIPCTGAAVTTIINIPFMHQLQKMEIKHVDASNADSTDALDYAVSHRHHPNLWMLLLNVIDSVASDIIDEYIDYFMGRGEYQLVTDSIATDVLYISVYIRITGD